MLRRMPRTLEFNGGGQCHATACPRYRRAWLRHKLGETAAQARYLHTVRGVGVKLTAPDR
jgi:hypothetical protein